MPTQPETVFWSCCGVTGPKDRCSKCYCDNDGYLPNMHRPEEYSVCKKCHSKTLTHNKICANCGENKED